MSEEQYLKQMADNLLRFEMPEKDLSEDKLLFRRIFRNFQISQEEKLHRKIKIVNSFESFTNSYENSGPKVLYITAKS